MNPSLPSSSSGDDDVISTLAKLINSHSVDDLPTLFRTRILPLLSASSPPSLALLPSLLSRLHSAHSSAPKSLRLFLLSLSHFPPSAASSNLPHLSLSLHHTLHSLARARLFSRSLSLLSSLPPPLLSHHHLSSLLLSYHAKFHPFPHTLRFFLRLRRIHLSASLPFALPHFNSLLRSFSSLGRAAHARAAFTRLHSHFPPDPTTLNVLLLAFRRSRNAAALDLFYHDALLRGFRPDAVTYNIRIDAYCKANQFPKALHLLRDMDAAGFPPNVRTFTTLVHGAAIAKNPFRARDLFEEISRRGLTPDRGAYNALMGALVRVGDLSGGAEVMDAMERAGVGVDDVSYYTLLRGFKKAGDFEGFCRVYRGMAEKGYVPRVRTVMLVMKYFCEMRRSSDLGLELWEYLVDKGCCPHRHTLDLLVTGLCSGKKAEVAYECFKQVVERGRWPSQRSFRMLEGAFLKSNEREKLDEMKELMKSLESLEPHRSSSSDYEDDEDDFEKSLCY